MTRAGIGKAGITKADMINAGMNAPGTRKQA